jgi:hypothetical protein
MEIFNEKFQKRLKKQQMFSATILLVTTIGGYFLLDKFLPEYQILFLLIVLLTYAFVSILFYFKHYNYLFISLNDKRLVIRYFRLGLIGDKSRKEIVIPTRQFYRYEIQSAFGGWRKELVLFQQNNQGVSKYKPISIEALSQEEQTELETALTNIKK